MTILNWIELLAIAIGTFSTVSTMTPNRHDNAIVDIIFQVINVLGMNFGNSKNEVN